MPPGRVRGRWGCALRCFPRNLTNIITCAGGNASSLSHFYFFLCFFSSLNPLLTPTHPNIILLRLGYAQRFGVPVGQRGPQETQTLSYPPLRSDPIRFQSVCSNVRESALSLSIFSNKDYFPLLRVYTNLVVYIYV